MPSTRTLLIGFVLATASTRVAHAQRFTLEQVISMATQAPAKVINKLPKHGTLQIGAPADATLLEVVEGPVEFVDTRDNKRQGKVFIRPVGTITNGVAFGRPYHSPFAVH